MTESGEEIRKAKKQETRLKKERIETDNNMELHGLSLRQNNSNRMTRVLNYMKEKRWKLLSLEIRGERERWHNMAGRRRK